MVDGERGIIIDPEFEETPKELLETRIKNTKELIEREKMNLETDSNPEMKQIYEKRIGDLKLELASLEEELVK